MVKLIISEPSIILKSTLKEMVDEVIDEKDEFNYNVFDFEETPFEEIVDCLQTPSFSSPNKVVICKNTYFIGEPKKKLPFENKLDTLFDYLEDPNPDCLFIMICPLRYFNNKSDFLKKYNKYGELINLSFKDVTDFQNYGMKLIKATNIKMTDGARNILFERCAGDVCKLEREIAKLALFEDEIDMPTISSMVSAPLEDNVFKLSNALLAKKPKEVMKTYNDLKLLKQEPIMLIGMLANQFRLMLQVFILRNEGKSNDEIANMLDVHPYRVSAAVKSSINYNINDVKNILVDLATLDAKIKKGEADRYVDFELFLATK